MDFEAPLLLIAMKEEAWAFPRPQREGGRRYLRVGGLRHELLFSGPGPRSVAKALSGRRPAAILNVGFAGALRPDLEPGMVLRVAAIRRGPELLEVEAESTPLVLGDCPSATLVTITVPASAAMKAKMHADGAGDLVDMESAEVFAFCRDLGIPYTGLRVVSDALGELIPSVVEEAFDGRRFRLGPMIRAFITDGAVRRQLLQLRRRARAASTSLAALLFPSS